MATVYKRTNRKPIPDCAVIKRSTKTMPQGAEVKNGVATWIDREGCKRSAKVKGKKIVVAEAEWEDSVGIKREFVDHTETVLLVVDDHYTADFRVGARRVRKSTKVSDKAAAQRIADQWQADEHLRQEGVKDDTDISLAKHAALPIADQVNAFIDFRATKKGSEEHRERTRKHIVEFITAGRWKSIREISMDDVTRHVATLEKDGKSSRTIQARLQSIKSFTRWLANSHRLRLNPLSEVQKPNPEDDRKHERRMLLPDEWTWLEFAVSSCDELRNGMSAAERLLLYRTAIQTGLRAGELFELTRGRLTLDSGAPCIVCKAAGTKNKKNAQQFVDVELAADLADHVSKKLPKAPVFSIGGKNELSRMVEDDLRDARRLWLESLSGEDRIKAEESDFLARTNHEGEHLVFHSLRHTCGAWLAMAGESIKVVQEVMRHSTPVLTLNTYGHLFPGQCEAAPGKIAAMMERRQLKNRQSDAQ